MKTTIISMITALLIISAPSFSQLERGNILAGGDIANFQLGLEEGSAFSMELDPKLAFFIRDNVALGGYLNFGLQTLPNTTGTITSYGVGGLGRYYLRGRSDINPVKNSRLFFEGNAGISGVNIPEGSNTNGLGLGIGPGFAYFITDNVGLETLLKYNAMIGFGNETVQSNLNLNVGFQIYLPSRRTRERIQSDIQ